MAVTLKDVASRLGLSVPTVSAALRNDLAVRLAPGTREKIHQVAREMGYSHNMYARGLRTGKSRVIGLLMESLTLEVALYRLQSVYDMIGGREYGAEMRNTRGIPCDESRFLLEFAGRMAEGVLAIQGLASSSFDSVSCLMNHGIPVVSMEPAFELDIDWVTVDRRYGGYIATKHLIDTGHEKIALLHGKLPNERVKGRITGYMQALEESGIQIDEKLFVRCVGTGSPKDGYEATKTLLSRQTGFTAVFCNNDQLAFGAMRAMLDEGLRIPDDVAVVGFDNITLSAYVPVPLTTVRQPVEEVARLATDLLFQRIEGVNTALPRQMIAVKPSLVVRESSGIR